MAKPEWRSYSIGSIFYTQRLHKIQGPSITSFIRWWRWVGRRTLCICAARIQLQNCTNELIIPPSLLLIFLFISTVIICFLYCLSYYFEGRFTFPDKLKLHILLLALVQFKATWRERRGLQRALGVPRFQTPRSMEWEWRHAFYILGSRKQRHYPSFLYNTAGKWWKGKIDRHP